MESASVPENDRTPPEQPGAFVCPECGKPYGFAKSLGTHRRNAHGIVGTSRSAMRSREKRLRENAEAGVERAKPVFAKEAKPDFPWKKSPPASPGQPPRLYLRRAVQELRRVAQAELTLEHNPIRRLELFELLHALEPFEG